MFQMFIFAQQETFVLSSIILHTQIKFKAFLFFFEVIYQVCEDGKTSKGWAGCDWLSKFKLYKFAKLLKLHKRY